MRLLLDTHVLLWWLADDPRLQTPARTAIATAELVAVSVASAWEIGIKQVLGKLDGPEDLRHELEVNHLETLSIDLGHALTAAGLPRLHDDPFDRMLIAQAQHDDLVLVSADRRIHQYGGVQFLEA